MGDTDSVIVELRDNGGFPEPLAGEPIRLVRARHETCGAATRLRLPGDLPASAVRRVVCQGCHEPFETDQILEVGVVAGNLNGHRALPAPGALVPVFREPRAPVAAAKLGRARSWLNPRSRAWRLMSIPIAAAAVVGGLLLIQGSDQPARHAASSTSSGPHARSRGARDARVVKGSSFTVALPPGWRRTNPNSGATFAASSAYGTADATLWIERAPGLSFHDFQARSLGQLRGLAGSAHVVDRVAAPTPEGTVVTLAADNPPGQPSYEVTLRVAGPYRYYLATSVKPNASRDAVDGAELIHNSFVPTSGGGSR